MARKSTERRLAALEGLKTVNLPPALKALEKLTDDREKAIREAAEVAPTDLRARNSVDRPEAWKTAPRCFCSCPHENKKNMGWDGGSADSARSVVELGGVELTV